jgi:predicted dehydrogenase
MAIKQLQTSRRRFLKAAAVAVAAPYVIPASALGAEGRPAPSNRITMGFVGVGGQGSGDMGGFLGFPEVQALAVCDVDSQFRLRAKQRAEQRYAQQKASGTYKGCDDYNDFRDLCERPDIDAVFCATPDHWHALVTCTAMRNGKDVYCEKPETLTVREGRIMIETARRYGRVFSGGSQRVWQDYNWYHRMMWAGAVGELQEVFVGIGGPSGEMLCPAEPVPEGMDWDMWLGPAPWRPYNQAYHPFRWRGCRDFSGGGMTDWGAHHIGGALFASQLYNKSLPVEVIPPDGKDNKFLTFKYASGVQLHLGGNWDGPISFKGTHGEVPNRRGPRQAPPEINIPNYKGTGGIFGDFLHCVRTRERPFRDIEIAHRTVATCHLANIAFWTGRAFKFNPVTEQIVGDEEANRWIDRPKRAPWVL